MIIGLMGYAQSGKDTVANILVENYGYTRVAFADKIRDFLYEINPIISVTANEPMYLRGRVGRDGWDTAKKSPEVRRLLQDLGVGARNLFSDMFWVQQALREVHFEGNYVITDVRFKNEAVSIKKYDNAELWRVKRPGVDAVNGHVSEHELEGYPVDQIIYNNGSLSDLEDLVKTRMGK